MNEKIVKLAIKHQINLGMDHNGFYFNRDRNGNVNDMSFYPTIKSARNLIKRAAKRLVRQE